MKIVIDKNKEKYKKIIDENSFMSNTRKQKILQKNIFSWIITDSNTTLHFSASTSNIILYKKCIQKILLRITMMRSLFDNKKPLDIWIFLSNYKKIIPSNKILCSDNVNSGSSTTYLYNNDNGVICIWRKEEIYKVLVHELFHAFRIDNAFPNPVEAYTEYHALIFNIFFELYERNIPITCEMLQKCISIEKDFCIEQCKKIQKCTNKDTNIFYYILDKASLLYNCTKDSLHSIIESYDKPLYSKKESLRFTIIDKILDKNKNMI